MNITLGESIEIAIMVVQTAFGWMTIRRQSEPRVPPDANRNEIRRATSFLRSIAPFDAFAFLVSISALLVAALVQPGWLVPWAQRLVPFFFVALASSVFALTVVRVQANRFSKDLTNTLNNLNIDGGEF